MGWVYEQSPKRRRPNRRILGFTEPKFFSVRYLQFDFDLGAFSQRLLVDFSMFDLFELNLIKFLRFYYCFYMDDKYVVKLCVTLTLV